MPKIYDEASSVNANEGNVKVDGPDGVSVTLTPDAAIETSDRLHEAGVEANGQRVLSEKAYRDRHGTSGDWGAGR
jgi:hypothetical protein